MSEDDESPPERKIINSRKTLTQSDIEDLISEDETSPVAASSSKKKMFQPDWKDLISEEENSPIKRLTRSAKKSFVWSEESDEETINLIVEKVLYRHILFSFTLYKVLI